MQWRIMAGKRLFTALLIGILVVFSGLGYLHRYLFGTFSSYLLPRDEPTPHVISDDAIFNSSAPCSLRLFQKYTKINKHLVNEGNWEMKTQRNKKTVPLKFTPRICDFGCAYNDGHCLSHSSFSLTNCVRGLGNNNSTKITIWGDSNGRRYADGLIGFLKSDKTMKCHVIKQEAQPSFSFKHHLDYYSNNTISGVLTHDRDCGSCNSILVRCVKSPPKGETSSIATHIIEVEFLSFEYFLDTEISTYRAAHPQVGGCNDQLWNCPHSLTHQEFILAEYMKDNFPDWILLFTSSHDIGRDKISRIQANVGYLLRLMELYLPKTTSVLWLSLLEHTPSKFAHKKWKNIKFEGKYSLSQQINRLNKAIFEELRVYLDKEDSKIFSFFDLQAMSSKVARIWSSGGIHMVPKWYDHVMYSVMRTLCET